ncbi:MAG: DUF2164 domain-containing protein [Pseudomonadota bacterium]
MAIELDPDRRSRFIGQLQNLFAEEFDEDLSEFQASEVVSLFLKKLGPSIYNQAVQDVRAHLQSRLDDLDTEIYVDVID